MKIALVIDSGTGEPAGELMRAEIYSVLLQASCDNKDYQDLEELGIDEIYALMKDGKMLSTFPPSLGKVEELFQGLEQQGYDTIFAVPICSELSGTISAMEMIAQQQGVVLDYADCHVTAVVQEYMIKLTKQLHEAGKSIEQIKEVLQHIVHATNTILSPGDLQHPKRDGRLASLAATLSGLLKIKPTLEINKETSGKIDVLDKVRTTHKAMDRVAEIMKCEHVDDPYLITAAHADDEAEASVYMDKPKRAFPSAAYQTIKLVSVAGVHMGCGCQAVQYFKQVKK